MARVHQEQALQQMRAQLRAREEAEEEEEEEGVRDHDQVIWYMYICTMCTCLAKLVCSGPLLVH